MSKSSIVLVAAIGIAAAIAGFAVSQRWQTSSADGEVAPSFSLMDLRGDPVTLEALRGKLVLINFWAPWCAPCLKEIPLLVEAQARFGMRGLQILGPALDEPASVRESAQRLKMNYPVLIGENDIPNVMDALGDTIGALPFSVLISTEGTVVARKYGEFTAEELADVIEPHLPKT